MFRDLHFIIVGLVIHGAAVAAPAGYALSVNIGGNVASATLTGEAIGANAFHVTGGALEVTAGSLAAAGIYSLIPGGPGLTHYFGVSYDNVLYPENASVVSAAGLLFGSDSLLIKIVSDEDPYSLLVMDGSGVFLGGTSGDFHSVSLTAIPEPGSLMLAALGLAAMAAMRRPMRRPSPKASSTGHHSCPARILVGPLLRQF